MPDDQYNEDLDYYESFAQMKNTTAESARQMRGQVQEMAKQAGLRVDFDHAKFSSTDDATEFSNMLKKRVRGMSFSTVFTRLISLKAL